MLDEFKLEADEMLIEAEESFIRLSKGESFLQNFNQIFRAFHSLKGAAGMFELDELQSYMHTLEDQFESLREIGKLNENQIDYFLMAIDGVKEILSHNKTDFQLKSFEEIDNIPTKQKPKIDLDQKILRDNKPKVFIVDDEILICEPLQSILKELNLEVRIFSDSKIALEEIIKTHPDLVCTDLKMPGLTGIELLKEARKRKVHSSFIFISAYVDNTLLTQGLELGAMGFLEKPFEEDQVMTLVSNAVSRAKAQHLLNRSINYILYQFNDLDNYLKSNGKETLRKNLRVELEELLKLRKELSSFNIKESL